MRNRATASVIAWLLGGAAAPAVAAACGDGLPLRAAGAGYTVAFAPQPAKVVVGQHFRLDAVVCAEPGQPAATALKVDADMPAHRHGMNYRPSLKALGNGRYRADGLLLHMPGRWRLSFVFGRDRLSHEVDVE